MNDESTNEPLQPDMQERLERVRELSDEQLKKDEDPSAQRRAKMEDFVFDLSENKFWDVVLCAAREPNAVNKAIPLSEWTRNDEGRLVKPTSVIGQSGSPDPWGRQRVEETTWAPGESRIIENKRMMRTGMVPWPGHRALNRYLSPDYSGGIASDAKRWVDHVIALWPKPIEHNYFFDYCAHMIQRPWEKCFAGIMLSGSQGVGKDLTLMPLKYAVGRDNASDIHPDDLFKTFNTWAACVMLVINEVRPTEDDHKASSIYQILKDYIIGTDALTLEAKHLNRVYIPNCLRVFATMNDPLAMFIPEDDRRLFMMHTSLDRTWADENYFRELVEWIKNTEGVHVAKWLSERDISKFNPGREPPKTAQWNSVSATWGEADDAVSYALDQLGNPDVLFASEMLGVVSLDHSNELQSMLRAHRKLPHRMHLAGYTLVKSQSPDGRWAFKDSNTGKIFKSRAAYAKHSVAFSGEDAIGMLIKRGAAIVKNECDKATNNVVPFKGKTDF